MGGIEERMSVVERANFIYSVYDQSEIDHLFNTMSREIVTHVAQEVVNVKTKFEAGSEQDTDEIAEQIMYSVVDEVADRMKAEVRMRVKLGREPKK